MQAGGQAGLTSEEHDWMRLLFTNHDLEDLRGSEVNCFQLASHFRMRSDYVQVFCFRKGSYWEKMFADEDIDLVSLGDIAVRASIRNSSFDVVWTHHWPTLAYVKHVLNVSATYWVHSSLSPYEPLEGPTHDVCWCDLVLANSTETRDRLIMEGIAENSIHIFPNFIDSRYTFLAGSRDSHERRILVVSNHVPEELLNAVFMLRKAGYAVDIIGEGYKKKFVDQALVIQYDMVVSIGKTVPYGLFSGIPVYLYDHFGGCGILTEQNFDKASLFNFSGRGFDTRKNAKDIHNEVVHVFEDYSFYQQETQTLARKVADTRSLDRNIERVFTMLEQEKTDNYNNACVDQRRMIESYVLEVRRLQRLKSLVGRMRGLHSTVSSTAKRIRDNLPGSLARRA